MSRDGLANPHPSPKTAITIKMLHVGIIPVAKTQAIRKETDKQLATTRSLSVKSLASHAPTKRVEKEKSKTKPHCRR